MHQHTDPHPQPWPVYPPDAIEACASLLAAGRSYDYARGTEIAALEDHFASQHNRSHALAVNSGTSALFLAYQALGVTTGDEVVVPTFTFPATATPLLWLGARPVLVDCGEDSGNLTAETIASGITERTRGIAVTHLYGHPCDMPAIVRLAREKGLFLVEDCSHAHGAHDQGRRVGTWGDAAVFSLGARKPVSGGHGGMLLTDRTEVYETACLSSASQRRSLQSVRDPQRRLISDTGLGGNLRISPMAAVLAHAHLRQLDELIERKRSNGDRLVRELATLPGLSAVTARPGTDAGGRFGLHMVYDAAEAGLPRDQMITRLTERGLRIGSTQTTPLHLTSLSRSPDCPSASTSHGFPLADRLARTWISLPADYLHGDATALIRHYVRHFKEVWQR
ncbi:DegT/DnrJ/EryC1/StrS family aminotransferase [Streptomyces collinus]|uniref:DegT/DnrJ/EryC1/StrS family aminotransferase n=1 Tax=Streptomyces collinus TaxID=42684 RepID=UPI0029420D0C|nr:DegT/DnrJ/EryC1/StrS family aminotransferase [Streptomyces collinus]